MDEEFARQLEAVDCTAASQEWQSLAISLPFPAVPVRSWGEAIAHCTDQSWEDATLEAQNRLTEFLHKHHRDDYQHWNVIVAAAKTRIVTPLVERVWRPFADRHSLGKVLVDCMSWDVLAAIMEHEYRRFSGRPEFSLHLLRVVGSRPAAADERGRSGEEARWTRKR